MLKRSNQQENNPARVVVLGGKGFVGATTSRYLTDNGFKVLALGRQEIDLSKAESVNKLVDILNPNDALVVIAAKAPCKNYALLLENITIMKNVCDALTQKPMQQVIYISSDAVYTDSMDKLSEASLAAPTSLHGVMHLAREQMLASILPKAALTILRPSLLYGEADPHNGYGPNSFYRLALAGQPIKLFGNGEELRDHVYIKDVAEIIRLCLVYRTSGVLNITSGEVVSFYDIAQKVKQVFNEEISIECQPRTMPMPHNGYRAFDNSACKDVFPSFQYTSFSDGLVKVHEACLQMLEKGGVNA